MKNRTMFIAGMAVSILFAIIIFIYFGKDKRFSYQDEIYTYTITLSNKPFFQFNIGEWTTGEEVEKSFVYDSRDSKYWLFENIRTDKVHPPVYYMAFFVLAHIFSGNMSLWIPLMINLASFLVVIAIFYYLSYKLTGNAIASALVCILISVNSGVVSSAMFIRMYMLLTMWIAIFTLLNYWFMCDLRKWYVYVLLCLTTILGFLTQYYFAIYAVFSFAMLIVYTAFRRDKEGNKISVKEKLLSVSFYLLSMLIAVLVSNFLWPEWKDVLESSEHAGAMTDKLSMIGASFIENLQRGVNFVFGTVFGKMQMFFFILTIVLIIMVFIFKPVKKSYSFVKRFFPVMIVFAAVFDSIIITEVAPDYLLSNRYYYSQAFIMLFAIMMLLYMVLSALISLVKSDNKVFRYLAVIPFVIVITVFSKSTFIDRNIEYYTDTKAYDNHQAILKQYSDYPWILSGYEGWVTRGVMFDFVYPDNIILVVEGCDGSSDEFLSGYDKAIVFGYDDNADVSSIGADYFSKATGAEVTKTFLTNLNSFSAYLVETK